MSLGMILLLMNPDGAAVFWSHWCAF